MQLVFGISRQCGKMLLWYFFCLISRHCGTFFWVGVAADYSNLKWGVGGNEKIIIRLHFFGKKFGKLKPFRFPGCAVPAKFVPSSSLFRYLFSDIFWSLHFFLIFKEKIPVKVINKLFSISRKKKKDIRKLT